MDNARIAYNFFIQQGWSPVQAAGIVGNLMQESHARLDPNALRKDDAGPGLHSMGLGQWNRERLAALHDFASARRTSPRDFETQLAFVQHELNTTEKMAATALKRATTLDEATAAFIGYERPQGFTWNNPRGGHGFGQRLAYAQQVAGLPASPQGTAMGGFAGGPTEVAARSPQGVSIQPADDPSVAVQRPPNAYQRMMARSDRNAPGIAKAQQMEQVMRPSQGGGGLNLGAGLKNLMGGGKGGAGGKGGMTTNAAPARAVSPAAAASAVSPAMETPPSMTVIPASSPFPPKPMARPPGLTTPPMVGPPRPSFAGQEPPEGIWQPQRREGSAFPDDFDNEELTGPSTNGMGPRPYTPAPMVYDPAARRFVRPNIRNGGLR